MLQFLILTGDPNYRLQQGFFVVSSNFNLPVMNFTTLAMTSEHKVTAPTLHVIITMVQIPIGAPFAAR